MADNLKEEYGFNEDYEDYGVENQETGKNDLTSSRRKLELGKQQ